MFVGFNRKIVLEKLFGICEMITQVIKGRVKILHVDVICLKDAVKY